MNKNVFEGTGYGLGGIGGVDWRSLGTTGVDLYRHTAVFRLSEIIKMMILK